MMFFYLLQPVRIEPLVKEPVSLVPDLDGMPLGDPEFDGLPLMDTPTSSKPVVKTEDLDGLPLGDDLDGEPSKYSVIYDSFNMLMSFMINFPLILTVFNGVSISQRRSTSSQPLKTYILWQI